MVDDNETSTGSELDAGNVRGSRRFKSRDHHMEMERVATTREYADAREMSDEEYYRHLNESDGYLALPQPPKVPGWHFKWSTTQGENDNVQNDMRLGYVPVKYSELPGFLCDDIKTGAYEGCVGHKEMILTKIPESRYQIIMTVRHWDKPRENEQKILELSEQALTDDKGRKIGDMAEGTAQLGKASGRPVFK